MLNLKIGEKRRINRSANYYIRPGFEPTTFEFLLNTKLKVVGSIPGLMQPIQHIYMPNHILSGEIDKIISIYLVYSKLRFLVLEGVIKYPWLCLEHYMYLLRWEAERSDAEQICIPWREGGRSLEVRLRHQNLTFSRYGVVHKWYQTSFSSSVIVATFALPFLAFIPYFQYKILPIVDGIHPPSRDSMSVSDIIYERLLGSSCLIERGNWRLSKVMCAVKEAPKNLSGNKSRVLTFD